MLTIISFTDAGKQPCGGFLSVFSLSDGRELKNIFTGITVGGRMLSDQQVLLDAGISMEEIERLGLLRLERPRFMLDPW